MSEWRRRWRGALEAACDEQPLDEAVVSAALGLVYVNRLLMRPAPELALAERLRSCGATCLAQLAREILESGDPEGEAGLRLAVARAGLHALDLEDAGDDARTFAEAFTPEPNRVVELLACRLEGVSAARAAAALSRDRPALERARSLARVMDKNLDELLKSAADEAGAEPRFRVAAGDVLALRDPALGRVVGSMAEPAIEAVLFEDGENSQLALYATEPVALRLEAEGATTEDMQPGYWLGRLAPGVLALEAKVYCADVESSWSIALAEDA